jgi:4-hydroxybutyrate CoA-transferase
MAVARNVNYLIDNGSVLSIGIGAIPEAVVRTIDKKRNLGVHSGMITDAIITPIKEKIITNEQKNIDKDKTVAALALGTKRLFQFIDENPKVEMHPYSYTHDIKTVTQLDNLVSINSAVEVDLTGQINAESIDSIQISTIGGQADFVRGAALSKGGKCIIALTSTTKNGKISKIIPQFKAGTIVSTPRYDVQYVVTEYGIAELCGKTLSQRMSALISIAHPQFRDELYQASKASRDVNKGA